MTMAMLTVLAVVSAPAFPQGQPSEGISAEQPMGAEDQPDDSAVETILREQEQLLSGEQFSYDPNGRRDPFRSLFETLRPNSGGKRPPGVAGMLVAEVDLTGIVKDDNGGNKAMVMGSDNKGYFLGVGDSVYDGTLIAIDPRLGTITFRQKINDPRIIKPYRDVLKRLVPLNEESADE
jgi:hypothetical protein